MDDQTTGSATGPVGVTTAEEEEQGKPVCEEDEEEEVSEEVLDLRRELASARDIARSSEMRCRQLQVLLEEEQFESAQKAEGYLRKIQTLQAELRAVGREMEDLRETRETDIAAAREEAGAADDDMAALGATAEHVSAEQEADIALLQEELKQVRVELERASDSTHSAPPAEGDEAQVDEQIVQLREYFERAERECQRLKAEFQRAQDDKTELKGQLAQLERDLYSTRERNTQLCSEVADLRGQTDRAGSSGGDASDRDGPLAELRDGDGGSDAELRDRLRNTCDRAQFMEEEYRDSRARVVEWQERCQWSENDRDWLGSELQRCHDLLTSLEGDDDPSQKPWIKRIPMLAIVIAVAMATLIPRINKLMS